MPTLELLGTDHCELCEQALEWMLAAPLVQGLPLTTVDIAGSEALVDCYGERVPVLLLRHEGEVLDELTWPFSERGLEALLRHPGLPAGP